ncbi:hypothetical protein [Companilactobacillus muriivasis]|uniref:hypothetical protein n=1 Tax=Companilactobacillus muriivasis TaxID=3081444 RepID=UPI0030C6A852
MDKGKIFENLLDIRELTGGADNPVTEKIKNKDLFHIRNIATQTLDELVSKSNMPEIFDNWMRPFKQINADVRSVVIQLNYLGMNGDKLDKDSVNGKLYDWISSSPDNYVRCLEAIIHDYEVDE